ncbi:MAG TPA: AAA family ATPase, partial [Candidatus Acidoferrales bacterium]|nr:AAA family ATPase [Candidatus Acidoferrales bacterium]
MSSRLVSLDFSRELARLTHGFTGRAWLFQRLAELMDQETGRLILLTGEPGIGKSALAARLVGVRQDVAAHHFCFARRVATITPGTVIHSLASQLCASLPDFQAALLKSIKPWQVELNVNIHLQHAEPGAITTGVNIHNIPVTNPDEELELLLRAPLAAMTSPRQTWIIVIDALDEALGYQGTPHLVELLAKLYGLPAWLRLFCTSRRSDSVLSHLQPLQPLVLEAGSAENLADVRAYVRQRASAPPISDRLPPSEQGQSAFVERVTTRAAGNFLYAAMVLDDVAAGHLATDALEELPQGLDEVYAGFLRRIPDAVWQSTLKLLLGKLAVAQEPLTEDQLAGFTGLAPSQVRAALGTLDQYLSFSDPHAGDVSFELFHESLRDFLLAKKRAGRYWCNPAEEHCAIADYYLAGPRTPGLRVDFYRIRYLPLHLCQAGKAEALARLLSDYSWLKIKLENTSVYDVLADFRLAQPQPPIDDCQSILRLSTFALEREAQQLWSQFYSRSLERASPLLRDFPASPDGPWLRLQRPSVRQSGDALKWVFHGHTDLVKDVRAVPNSSLVVSCSFDRTIRIWDLASGREVRRITGHAQDVNSVALSPDGTQIISGSDDRTVRIWDLHSGLEMARIDQLPHTPEPVVVSPDGAYLAGVLAGKPSYNHDIWIWSATDRTLVTIIRTHEGIDNITFIPRSTWIAGRAHKHVVIWDIPSGAVVRRYEHKGSDGFPNPAIAASPDGQYLASGGTESGARIKVFRLSDDSVLVLPKPEGIMRCLAFSPDGKQLLAAARPGQLLPDDNVIDDSVDLWDLESRVRLARYPHDGFVQAIAFSSDGTLGICATGNGKISVWQLGKTVPGLEKHSAQVIRAIVRHPKGRTGRVFTAAIDGSVFVWDLETLTRGRVLRSKIPLVAMDVNANGSRAFTSGFEVTWVEGDDVYFRELL